MCLRQGKPPLQGLKPGLFGPFMSRLKPRPPDRNLWDNFCGRRERICGFPCLSDAPESVSKLAGPYIFFWLGIHLRAGQNLAKYLMAMDL